MADRVLHSGVRSITDLMVMPGLINLDFADVRTVMSEMGKAMMGTARPAATTAPWSRPRTPSPTRCWTKCR
jgi:cell division protein FtsZ